MAYDIIEAQTIGNIGVGRYPNLSDLGRLVKLVHSNTTQQFATATAAEVVATWNTNIKTKQMTPFPISSITTPKGKEPAFKEFPQGGQMKVNDGSKSWELNFYYPHSIWKQFKKWDGVHGKWYLGYSTGKILGYSPDGAKMEGLAGTIFVNPFGETDGTDGNMTTVTLVLDNIDDLKKGVTINPSTWKITDLDAIHNVVLALVGSALATGFVFTATIQGYAASDPRGWLTGLVKADFEWLKADDTTQVSAITTLTDNGDGSYTVVGTGIVTGSFNLLDPDDVTYASLFIESTGEVAITIA
jgi:hypothetical protein